MKPLIRVPRKHVYRRSNRLMPWSLPDTDQEVSDERKRLHDEAFPFDVRVSHTVYAVASMWGWCKENLEYPHSAVISGDGIVMKFQTSADQMHFRLRF